MLVFFQLVLVLREKPSDLPHRQALCDLFLAWLSIYSFYCGRKENCQ